MAKRHHYVPVTYLRNFADAAGQLRVFRKDDPDRSFRQRPEATAFKRYYYSQIAADGDRDDDRLEALFSEVESIWPAIVSALARREAMFDAAPQIITFLALMRVRVPAFRDVAELYLGQAIHTQALVMRDSGRLPPPPPGHDDLIEKLLVAIDPQKSLELMAQALDEIGKLLAGLSFDVLHNPTDVAFLTSDNPVMYFDPGVTPQRMMPYTVVAEGGRVELLFPVSTHMVLRGRSRPKRADIGHRTVTDHRTITRINRLICRFAYRTVFARDTREAELIAANADVSPVARLDRIPAPGGGYHSFGQFIFGPRPDKPRWDGSRERPVASNGDPPSGRVEIRA